MNPPGFDDAAVRQARPFVGAPPAGPVVFRAGDEGFVVEELPAYLPEGAGEHLYLWVEKRGLSTPALVKRLQDRFGLDEREIGYAGRKDERGITRQWLSVPAVKVEHHVAAVADLGVTLLEAKRHKNKLRLGHLRGNRFTIALTGIDAAVLQGRADVVRQGIPNLFGAQRFGAGGSTLEQAVRFVERGRPPRGRRDEFLVSALQSSLFNAWLADRVEDETWNAPLDGDVLEKLDNGAPFECTDPIADAPRLTRGEVAVAGPLVGRSMRPAQREAMTRESRSWEKHGVDVPRLLAHPAFKVGARRPACLWPADVEVGPATGDASGVSVRFSLAKGAYASVVLRALVGPALVDAAFVDGGRTDNSPHPPAAGAA